MAILTKFLQLLKPEKNDYVDVEKHLSENYDKIDTKMEKLSNSNDEKLDKGAVSTEYDTAKKIEDKLKEIDTKFKNYCPISVGSVDARYDSKNPAELYPSTTWELISSDKYIRTGSIALSTGGNNSIILSKENLPNTKLKVDSFSVTIPPHYHNEGHACWEDDPNAFGKDWTGGAGALAHRETTKTLRYRTSTAGGGSTSSASPYTSSLGSGTAITIQPTYITLKLWKRLT